MDEERKKERKKDFINVFTCFEKFSKATSIYFAYSIKQFIFVKILEFFSVR
jgi:hypothetical protein